MTPTVEKILAEVNALSIPERAELQQALAAEPMVPKDLAAIRELRGKYKEMTSTEVFMLRKREEMASEEHDQPR